MSLTSYRAAPPRVVIWLGIFVQPGLLVIPSLRPLAAASGLGLHLSLPKGPRVELGLTGMVVLDCV